MSEGSLIAMICDVFQEDIYPAEVFFEDGIITKVDKKTLDEYIKIKIDKSSKVLDGILLPGFIESHIHIESTMLTPSRFAEIVIPHGTTTVIADPHEIANVMGIEGIDFMIQDGKSSPLNFYYTAPSCVPATIFESSGATLNSEDIEKLLQNDDIISLGEVMDFVGVINDDEEILAKIESAKTHNKPIDGHAPLLSGENLKKYVSKGISTDHESSTLDEAIEKAKNGMKIMVREGSSAKNMEDILDINSDCIELIEEGFLCSDDIHPQDLSEGHMDRLLRKAIKLGLSPFKALKMVSLNPAKHYNISAGSISVGNRADFVLVSNLLDFRVKKVFISGELVSENGKVNFKREDIKLDYKMDFNEKTAKDFELSIEEDSDEVIVRVIQLIPDQLITEEIESKLKVKDGIIVPDNDILKIAVVERYGGGKVSNAFIKGFNIKNAALASSIAHDSHNIVVVGTSSYLMAKAVEIIRKNNGGLAIVTDKKENSLKLPFAGLMSDKEEKDIVKKINELHEIADEAGSTIESPFTTLSFMALLVIPHLKLSDKGLFNVDDFDFVDVIKK